MHNPIYLCSTLHEDISCNGFIKANICISSSLATYPSTQILGFSSQAVRHLSAASGQVEDGRGGHVSSLHVVGVVEAALTTGGAGTTASPSAPSSTAQAATAAAGGVGAGRATCRAGVLTVALG